MDWVNGFIVKPIDGAGINMPRPLLFMGLSQDSTVLKISL